MESLPRILHSEVLDLGARKTTTHPGKTSGGGWNLPAALDAGNLVSRRSGEERDSRSRGEPGDALVLAGGSTVCIARHARDLGLLFCCALEGKMYLKRASTLFVVEPLHLLRFLVRSRQFFQPWLFHRRSLVPAQRGGTFHSVSLR